MCLRFSICGKMLIPSKAIDPRPPPGPALHKIAMASYLKLYKENQGEDKEFEIRRTVGLADYIVRKWPTQPEAQEALSTLIPFMIRLQRLDEAEGYLQQIDPKLPRRGEAELQTGQAMWNKYLVGMQSLRDADKAAAAGETVDRTSLPKSEDLAELRTRAQKTLADGIDRMRQAPVDSTLVLAASRWLRSMSTRSSRRRPSSCSRIRTSARKRWLKKGTMRRKSRAIRSRPIKWHCERTSEPCRPLPRRRAKS